MYFAKYVNNINQSQCEGLVILEYVSGGDISLEQVYKHVDMQRCLIFYFIVQMATFTVDTPSPVLVEQVFSMEGSRAYSLSTHANSQPPQHGCMLPYARPSRPEGTIFCLYFTNMLEQLNLSLKWKNYINQKLSY